jgi:hypothetical protein
MEAMNGRSLRWLILLLIVCVALALSGAGLAFYLTHQSTVSSSTPPLSVIWKVSTTAFTQEDQQTIGKAVQNAIAAQAKDVPRPSEIDIITAQREGDWATFNTQQKTSSAEVLPAEPGFFLAHKQGSSWSLLLPGTPTFCGQLTQVPDTLLAPIDKRYFCQ